MARRRSLNRRWSRRSSLNSSAILDQDSNYIEEDENYWRHLNQTRYSDRMSLAESAEPVLNTNSRIIDDSNIDSTEWWNQLQKTTENFYSPGTNETPKKDVANVSANTSTSDATSITQNVKKRRIILGKNRPSLSENPFSQVLDLADVTIESEPIQSISKINHSRTLSRSIDNLKRHGASQLQISSRNNSLRSPESSTSTDTERITKVRPLLFRRPKRKPSLAFDELLEADDSVIGPSQHSNVKENQPNVDMNSIHNDSHNSRQSKLLTSQRKSSIADKNNRSKYSVNLEDTNLSKASQFSTQSQSSIKKARSRSSRSLANNIISDSEDDEQKINSQTEMEEVNKSAEHDSFNSKSSKHRRDLENDSDRFKLRLSDKTSKNSSANNVNQSSRTSRHSKSSSSSTGSINESIKTGSSVAKKNIEHSIITDNTPTHERMIVTINYSAKASHNSSNFEINENNSSLNKSPPSRKRKNATEKSASSSNEKILHTTQVNLNVLNQTPTKLTKTNTNTLNDGRSSTESLTESFKMRNSNLRILQQSQDLSYQGICLNSETYLEQPIIPNHIIEKSITIIPETQSDNNETKEDPTAEKYEKTSELVQQRKESVHKNRKSLKRQRAEDVSSINEETKVELEINELMHISAPNNRESSKLPKVSEHAEFDRNVSINAEQRAISKKKNRSSTQQRQSKMRELKGLLSPSEKQVQVSIEKTHSSPPKYSISESQTPEKRISVDEVQTRISTKKHRMSSRQRKLIENANIENEHSINTGELTAIIKEQAPVLRKKSRLSSRPKIPENSRIGEVLITEENEIEPTFNEQTKVSDNKDRKSSSLENSKLFKSISSSISKSMMVVDENNHDTELELSEDNSDENLKQSNRILDPSVYELPDRYRSESPSESDVDNHDASNNFDPSIGNEKQKTNHMIEKLIDKPITTKEQTENFVKTPKLLPSTSTNEHDKSKKSLPTKSNTLDRYFFHTNKFSSQSGQQTLLGPSSSGGLSQKNRDELEKKLKELKEKRDKIVEQEIAARMKDLKRLNTTATKFKAPTIFPNFKKKNNPPKEVDRAYIINGQVYKQPKLPRPQKWASNRLYKYLWKKMGEKYGLETRITSEEFIKYLSDTVTIIKRRKKYENYKDELDALIKKMAELGIIKTRLEFHYFCYDFLPYEFRVKVTPMLMPGSVHNIPFEPELLTIPISNANN